MKTKEFIEQAKQEFNYYKEVNWFTRTDLDKHFYGLAGQDIYDQCDTDDAYFQLFPQDILESIYTCFSGGILDGYEKIEATNVLKGLKQDGYQIVKINKFEETPKDLINHVKLLIEMHLKTSGINYEDPETSLRLTLGMEYLCTEIVHRVKNN